MTSAMIVMYLVMTIRFLEAANLNEPCGDCSGDNALCVNNLEGCDKGTCACIGDYRMTSPTSCKRVVNYQESCLDSTDACRDINMACVAKKCVCSAGYKYDSYIGKCIPSATTHLGDRCTTVNDCYQTTSDPNSIECATDDVEDPLICRCRSGYVQPKSSFLCRKQRCITLVGCAPSNKAAIDTSQVYETCLNGVCTCPLAGIQQRINVMGEGYNICMAKFFGTLKKNGEVCTASNECADKLCYSCPGESSKYCVKYDSGATVQTVHAGVTFLFAGHFLSRLL